MRGDFDFRRYPIMKFEGAILDELKARAIFAEGGSRALSLAEVILAEDTLVHFKKTKGFFFRFQCHFLLILGLWFFVGLWLPFLTGDYPVNATENHPIAYFKLKLATIGIFVVFFLFCFSNVSLWLRQVRRLISVPGVERDFVRLREQVQVLRFIAGTARTGCVFSLFASFFTLHSVRPNLLISILLISGLCLLLWQGLNSFSSSFAKKLEIEAKGATQ
jgi:hypothetical protein